MSDPTTEIIKEAVRQEIKPITDMLSPKGQQEKSYPVRMDRVERVIKALAVVTALVVAQAVNNMFNPPVQAQTVSAIHGIAYWESEADGKWYWHAKDHRGDILADGSAKSQDQCLGNLKRVFNISYTPAERINDPNAQ